MRHFFRQNDVLVREAMADLFPVHDPDHDGCHRSLSFCLAQTETGSNPFHLYSENLVFSYEQSLKGKISSFSPRFSPAIFPHDIELDEASCFNFFLPMFHST